MAIWVGKRGLIRRKKGKPYYGYKVYGRGGYGRHGWRYSRNKRIHRIIWS